MSNKTTQKENKEINCNKIFSGVVVSDKMDKTLVVQVEGLKTMKKYHKKYKKTKKYLVNDEGNEFKIGDKVEFEQCRPISSKKKWRVVKK